MYGYHDPGPDRSWLPRRSATVSGSVSVERLAWAARVSVRVRGPRHPERSRPTPSASRVSHTNSLTLSHTPPATREPRAGPAGGPQFPDKL